MLEPTQYHKQHLSNGMTVVSETSPYSQSVTISIWVKAGSRHEKPNQLGISHFLEHMVFKGTEKRRVYHIVNGIESVGGYINAMTDKESTCYYTRLPAEFLERGIEILSDLVFHPNFRNEDIEKEKQVVIDELLGVEDNAEDWIGDLFEEQLFSGFELSSPVIGKQECIENFSADDLNNREKIHHDPRHVFIAVSGKFDQQKLISLLEKHISITKKKAELLTTPFRIKKQKSRFLEIEKPINQSHLLIGSFAPKLSEKSGTIAMMLNAILGSGLSSRLNLKIREKHGYCYSIYSFFTSYTDIGLLGISASIENKKVVKLRDLIQKELDLLQTTGPTKREFDQIKQSLKGGLLISSESQSARNLNLSRSEMVYGRYKSVDEVISEIESVTVSDVENYLKKYPLNKIEAEVLIKGTISN